MSGKFFHSIIFLSITAATVIAQESNSGSLVTFKHNGAQMRIYQPPVTEIKTEVKTTEAQSGKQTPVPQECFQFTWPGTHLEQNSTVSCRNFTGVSKKNPCFEPFIDYADDDSPPNPFDVYNHCQKNGCPMKITCLLSDTGNCIRYAYYRDNKPVNITWFCGTVKDKTNNHPLRYGTRRDDLDGGDVLEVTFCNSNLCNSSLRNLAVAPLIVFLVSSLFVWIR